MTRHVIAAGVDWASPVDAPLINAVVMSVLL